MLQYKDTRENILVQISICDIFTGILILQISICDTFMGILILKKCSSIRIPVKISHIDICTRIPVIFITGILTRIPVIFIRLCNSAQMSRVSLNITI